MARAAAGRRNFRIHTKRRCMIKKKKNSCSGGGKRLARRDDAE